MSGLFIATVGLILSSAPAMAQIRGEGIFERADTNSHGSVTRAEFVAARGDQFGLLVGVRGVVHEVDA